MRRCSITALLVAGCTTAAAADQTTATAQGFRGPTHYFDRGFLASIDITSFGVSSHIPCRDRLNLTCKPGEVLRFGSPLAAGPTIGVTVAYRFWRYLALQAEIIPFGSGDNTYATNVAERNSALQSFTEGRVSVRADYPFTRWVAAFATYGIGYKTINIETNQSEDTAFHDRLSGRYRPITAGVAFNFLEDRAAIRFEYMPPAGGAGFALSQALIGFEVHL